MRRYNSGDMHGKPPHLWTKKANSEQGSPYLRPSSPNSCQALVPVVGSVSTVTFLAGLLELEQPNSKKIKTLVRVATLNQDSGRCRGKQSRRRDRSQVHRILSMTTLSATRFNPVIRAFLRLIDAGKLPKVTLDACVRKPSTILNATAQGNKTWQT